MTDLQIKILEIFKEVKKICDKHNLRYYATGGTCIGAVRHGGFIPWDDDLDIAMPDTDYKRFYDIAKRELPENLKVYYTCEKKNNVCLFMKVHDINTTFVEKYEIDYLDNYKGVFVDIFPIYGLPEEKAVQDAFLKKVDLLLRMNYKQKSPFTSQERWIGKLLWIINRPFPNNFWTKKWQKLASSNSFDNSTYVGFFFFKPNERDIYKKEWFNNYVDIPFEDTTVRCAECWDKYLQTRFGDYMKLPPVSERENHSKGAIIDLHRPFSYYQEKRRVTGQ